MVFLSAIMTLSVANRGDNAIHSQASNALARGRAVQLAPLSLLMWIRASLTLHLFSLPSMLLVMAIIVLSDR